MASSLENSTPTDWEVGDAIDDSDDGDADDGRRRDCGAAFDIRLRRLSDAGGGGRSGGRDPGRGAGARELRAEPARARPTGGGECRRRFTGGMRDRGSG